MFRSKLIKNKASFRKSGLGNIFIYIVAAFLMFYSLTLVAKRFGGSEGSDAYFFLFSMVTLSTAIVGSLFTTILIPVFVKFRVKLLIDDLSVLVGFILLWTFLIVFSISLIAYFNYERFFLLVSKFPYAQIVRNRNILIDFAPIVVISILAEYFRSLLLGLGNYLSAAVTALFQPLILIGFIIFFSDQIREQSLSLSLLFTKLVALIFMASVVVFKEKIRIKIVLIHKLPSTSSLKNAISFWCASFVTNTSTFFFDYMATGLGVGVITAVSYAQRVFSLPVTLILNPLLEVAYTNFSELHAHNNTKVFGERYKLLLNLVLLLSVPISIFFYFMADEIISSLFQRGAFGKESVEIASYSLRVFALAIVPSCVFMLTGRAVESFQKLLWPSVFGTFGNLLLIWVIFKLVNAYGYIGIPYSRALIYWFYFLPFGFIFLYILNGAMPLLSSFRTLSVAILASVLSMLMYFYIADIFDLPRLFPSLTLLGLIIIFFSFVYLAFIYMLSKKTLQNIIAL